MKISTFLLFFVLLNLSPLFIYAQCTTSGSIDKGSSTVLDANGDGYFTAYNNSGFTLSSNEFTEFEQLAGAGGANVAWTRLNGAEPAQDISGSGCSNTDIVTDADGGADYAYYSIVDPNSIADDGDEYLVFALRIANRVNGAFGYIFLIDGDNNCSSGDADAVCGNPCFEYEVELQTGNSGGTVAIHDVDGCYGTSDCDTRNGGGGSATICSSCNTDGLQVCAGSSPVSCSNTPVFWVFYINFSDLPLVNSTSAFSIVPGSNTSGNPIVYKSANVSDFGGLDDINDVNGACDCANQCSGSPCSKCEEDCLFECASASNAIGSSGVFPVDFLEFKATLWGQQVKLEWGVFQSGEPDHFKIQRLNSLGRFETIDEVPASKDEGFKYYQHFISPLDPTQKTAYRIVGVDLNGGTTFSRQLEVSQSNELAFSISANQGLILLSKPSPKDLSFSIHDLSGRLVHQVTIPAHDTQIKKPKLSNGIYLADLKDPQLGLIARELFTD